MTRKKKYLFIAILQVLLYQTGCDTNDIDPDFDGMGYILYPLETGLFRDYKIQHIKYTVLDEPDTSVYFLREHILDSVVNAEGGYTYVLARFSRDSLNHDWKLDSLWKAEKNSKFVRITENNVPYLKLVFPVKEGMSWDGNTYNSGEQVDYVMENVNMSFQASDTIFEESVTVIHEDIPDRIVRYSLKYEVYANNTGMVFKEYQDLNYCTNDHCLGMEIIDYGFKFRQELIGYGKN